MSRTATIYRMKYSENPELIFANNNDQNSQRRSTRRVTSSARPAYIVIVSMPCIILCISWHGALIARQSKVEDDGIAAFEG